MYKFSQRSLQRLNTCDPKLRALCIDAIKYVDFSVISGHRTKAEQDAKFPKYTKLQWPNSKHNKMPSHAVDVAPYIKPYGTLTGHPSQVINIANTRGINTSQAEIFVLKAYARLIGIFEGIAMKRSIKIKVGLDWDGDFDLLDQSFNDLSHIELKEEKRGFFNW
jgi:peptidoglycan L-alanyl-D-glutamate endopeptidase CwlK